MSEHDDWEYNKEHWTPFERMLDENKRLRIENEILTERMENFIRAINRDTDTIGRLGKDHYRIVKENEKMLQRIFEEIVSINMCLKNKL